MATKSMSVRAAGLSAAIARRATVVITVVEDDNFKFRMQVTDPCDGALEYVWSGAQHVNAISLRGGQGQQALHQIDAGNALRQDPEAASTPKLRAARRP